MSSVYSNDSIVQESCHHCCQFCAVYVPYSTLEKFPVTLYFGKVSIHLVMTTPSTCLVSVPSRFRIADSDSPGTHMSVIANLGTLFVVSYKERELEVRLGRRIIIHDTDTYTSSA